MTLNLQRPVVKWSVALIVLSGAGVLIFFVIRNAFLPARGLAGDRETRVTLTCVNRECPGERRAGAPYSFKKMIRGDFGDWPAECDACGRKTAYLKVRTEKGTFLIASSLSNPSVLCPHCGRIVEVPSLMAGPSGACPGCGEALDADVWKAPQQ